MRWRYEYQIAGEGLYTASFGGWIYITSYSFGGGWGI
jgi:hypothetical protein